MKRHAAAILLLLPVLYVGSYLALVKPEGVYHLCLSCRPPYSTVGYYRFDSPAMATFFWPLEQIDRRVRPRAWEPLW